MTVDDRGSVALGRQNSSVEVETMARKPFVKLTILALAVLMIPFVDSSSNAQIDCIGDCLENYVSCTNGGGRNCDEEYDSCTEGCIGQIYSLSGSATERTLKGSNPEGVASGTTL